MHTLCWGLRIDAMGFLEQGQPFRVVGRSLVPWVVVIVNDTTRLRLQNLVRQASNAMLFNILSCEASQSQGEDLPAGCVRVVRRWLRRRIVFRRGQDNRPNLRGVPLTLVCDRQIVCSGVVGIVG